MSTLQKKANLSQTQLEDLESKHSDLTKKNKELEDENLAYKEFVKDNISIEALQAELDKAKMDNSNLRLNLSEKEKDIAKLQQDLKNLENPKSTAANQHIKQLKTQVSAMEADVGQLQTKITQL